LTFKKRQGSGVSNQRSENGSSLCMAACGRARQKAQMQGTGEITEVKLLISNGF
tara:strand:- start:1023 stop:1184 length:162 start_codon:yes stop_codon:yes gene_type:complete